MKPRRKTWPSIRFSDFRGPEPRIVEMVSADLGALTPEYESGLGLNARRPLAPGKSCRRRPARAQIPPRIARAAGRSRRHGWRRATARILHLWLLRA